MYAIDTNKKLDDLMNTAAFIEAFRKLVARVDALEAQIGAVGGKRARRKHNYGMAIKEILSDGRMWTGHSILLELQQKYPEFAEVTKSGVCNKLGQMVKSGGIKRLAKNVYVAGEAA